MAPLNDLSLILVIVIIIIFLTIIVRLKISGGSVNRHLGKKIRKLLSNTSTAALIKYKPLSRYEDLVEGVVREILNNGRTVMLVSSAPRTEKYGSTFSESFEKGDLILVKVTANPRSERFSLAGGVVKKEELKGKVAEISVDWLEYLSEIVESLSDESTIVFEPLSDLLLMNGFEKTFKFIKKTIDYSIGRRIIMVAFINEDAHEDNVKASFEGLFTNIAEIFDDELKIIK